MDFMATFIVSGTNTGGECHKIARETLQDLITNLQQVLGKDAGMLVFISLLVFKCVYYFTCRPTYMYCEIILFRGVFNYVEFVGKTIHEFMYPPYKIPSVRLSNLLVNNINIWYEPYMYIASS